MASSKKLAKQNFMRADMPDQELIIINGSQIFGC